MNTTASTRIAAAILRRYGETVDVAEDLPGRRRPGRHERALGLPELSRRPGPGGAAAAPVRDGARVPDARATSSRRASSGSGRPRTGQRSTRCCRARRGSPARPSSWSSAATASASGACSSGAGRAFPNEHLDAFFNAAVDGAIVLSTFVQAAGLAGLGSCPISEIRNHAAAIGERLRPAGLGLPDRRPDARLARGERALQPAARAERDCPPRPLRRGPGRPGAGRYDERRIRERPYRRQRLIERFGQAARYGWTEDKARQYSEPQRADFGAFVRSKRYRLE